MPKSKGRRKPRAYKPPRAHTDAEFGESRSAWWEWIVVWRRRLGWAFIIVGLILFLGGNIGARIGLNLIPFDPHHVASQLVGGLLLAVGVVWGLWGQSRR